MGGAFDRIAHLDEEGRRSVARRGLLGHYVAGAYRTIARPIATQQIIARAKFLSFLWGMEEVAQFLQHQPSRYLVPLLRVFGATVADDAILGHDTLLISVNRARFAPLRIGRGVFLARRIVIDLASDVSFGDFCTVSYDCQFLSHIDVANSPLKAELVPVSIAPINIGRGVFIGAGTIVTSGVSIGECSLIGANSVVLNDIPPYSVAAGTPAKVLRTFDHTQVPKFEANEAFIIPDGTTL